jgi:hypothetical protein
LGRSSPPRTSTATIDRPQIVDAPTESMSIQGVADSPAPARRAAQGPPSYGFPWGDSLALIGALAVIMSAILDWGGPFSATLPRDISAAWLLDPAVPESGPSLGVLVLFAGTLGALVSLVSMAAPGFTFLRRGMGLLTLMIPIAFALRTLQGVAGEGGLSDLPSAQGVGVALAAAGGLVQMAAGRRRRIG